MVQVPAGVELHGLSYGSLLKSVFLKIQGLSCSRLRTIDPVGLEKRLRDPFRLSRRKPNRARNPQQYIAVGLDC